MNIAEKFLAYTKFDTTSNGDSSNCPSTVNQKVFAEYLVNHMKDLGLSNAQMDENGYVYAWIEASPGFENIETIGFIAHMDTSSAVSGKDIKARIIHKYDGRDIVLNQKENIVMKTDKYPTLLTNIGEDLIVTDGTTLLGADNKAGIAIILQMAQELLKDTDIKHGRIAIGFTPDEEIGRGANLFNVKLFNASYAYTVDGGAIPEIQYENFNASSAKIDIKGLSIHPGDAKGIMKNAVLIANEFISLLPANETPATTEGKEGFYHVYKIAGNEEKVSMNCLLRDHDKEKIEEKKERMTKIADYLNFVYGPDTVKLTLSDSYFNMADMILPKKEIIDRAVRAYEKLGYTATSSPIRGGTDGARLSYMGLPCPNLSTGGYNFHGRYEYLSIDQMEKMVKVLINIVSDIASDID